MTLIDQGGKRVRLVCCDCRKVHAPKDCPLMEWKIILALSSGEPYGEHYQLIASRLGIPWRRVQQTVGRLKRNERSRLG
jgi:hypothetical protein